MGLIVDTQTNEVVVDHTSNKHLHTTQSGNPVQSSLGNMRVDSVYRRLKASGAANRDRRSKQIGDNCPLIYALKKSEGLWVSRHSIKQLNTYTPSIISNVCGSLTGNIDCIVLIPSRHPLAMMLAKRLARNLKVPVYDRLLRKSTFLEASQRVQSLVGNKASLIAAGISREDEKLLRNVIKGGMLQGGAAYSAKDVRTSLRKHFDPLRLITGASLPSPDQRVLYADDLLATGETLLAADSILRSHGNHGVSRSVTWFSKV